MGPFANPPWLATHAGVVAGLFVALNAKLVADIVAGWRAAAPHAWWIPGLLVPAILGVAVLLVVIATLPVLRRLRLFAWRPESVAAPGAALARAVGGGRARRAIAEEVPYRRVAVALELAAPDRAILEHLRAMPLPSDARAILMHVAESAASRYLGTESSDEESREDLATLESLAEELRARGLPASVQLGNGDVKSELARMVEEANADLLIAGSHGHGLLGDLFFGATTSGLRHRVRCPVLIVRTSRARVVRPSRRT
jgi:manganese transport protein